MRSRKRSGDIALNRRKAPIIVHSTGEPRNGIGGLFNLSVRAIAVFKKSQIRKAVGTAKRTAQASEASRSPRV